MAETKYLLKAFDKNLAATGFQCALITGSYDVGDIIEEGGDIIIDTVKVARDEVIFTVSSENYTFNNEGICKTAGKSQYRLMLASPNPETTLEEILKGINENIQNVHRDLQSMNNTIASYLEQTREKFEKLDEDIANIEEEIPDVSDLVTQEEFNALEERVRALEDK